jgi:tripartite-type tricarboxylate transporter receptor subunit TctC
VPTVAETIPGFESSSWQDLFVPTNTPREIVMTIQRETAKALRATDLIERLRTGGNEPVDSTPDEFDAPLPRRHREVRQDREGRADSDAGLRGRACAGAPIIGPAGGIGRK